MARAGSANGSHLLSWIRFRGRNGVDDPNTLPADMGTEAINWVITTQGLGHRRRGTTKLPLTGTFTGAASMTRFQPTQDDGAAQLVFSTFDSPAKFMRVAGGLAAVEITQTDQLVGSPQLVSYATGNGKLFLAYKHTGGNRLHVYHPGVSSGLQFAGLPVPIAPSPITNVGTGSYPAVARAYRVQLRGLNSNIITGVSALGTSSGMVTPTGGGTAMRVSVASTATEKGNQWRLFGSPDNVLFYQLNDWTNFSTATFWDDSRLVSTYASLPAAPLEGSRYPLPSAKYLLWDGTRLLLFGMQTPGDQTGNDLPAVPGRVYITAALDSTVEGGDDESIVMSLETKGYVDCNRNGGSEDRAIVGPIDGNILVMQSRGIYLLKPTGAANRPYTRIVLSKELGCVSHWSTFVGEDEAGRPAIYWLDPHRGPYRYGYDGLEWLGYDVQDLWKEFDPALTTALVAHGLYDQRERRCYWWIVTGEATTPTVTICFFTQEGRATPTQGVRYGWTQWRGAVATGLCSVMFAETFGASMARRLKPYLGYADRIVQVDADGVNVDDDSQVNETAYVALLQSKAWNVSAAPQLVQLDRAWVRAECSNAILAQRLVRNHGDQEDLLSTVPLTPQGTEARRIFLFEDAQMAGSWTFETQLGDAAAADQFYALDRWDARITATDLDVGSSEL